MRILFLDIDGVLNSVGSFIYNNRLNRLGLSNIPTHESFDPIACSNLQYVLEELPDVQVVISSTWRKYKTLSALQEMFNTNNLFPERVIGTTPVSEEGYRGKEIEGYIKKHPEVTEFAIIDDNSDMKPYMDHLVQIDSRNGLTFTDAEKVIELFGDQMKKKKVEKSKLYHLLMYVEDCAPKMKKFGTTQELGKFIDKFNKKHPDYASVDAGYWIDYCITDVSGDVHFFCDGITVE